MGKVQTELESVLLTDDEVVALAIHAGASWPTAMPTVDVRDENELRKAAARGRRSLLVRSLAGEEVPGPALESLIGPVLNGRGVLATYAADRAFALVPSIVSTAHYSADGSTTPGESCVTEVVVPSGVHRLSRTTMDAAKAATIRLLQTALTSEALMEPPDSGEPSCICAIGPAGAAPLRMAVARPGDIRVGCRTGAVISIEDFDPVASAEVAVAFVTKAEREA